MMLARSIAVALAVTLCGCATDFQPAPLALDHPANAQAEEAPRSGSERLVAGDALTAKTKTRLTAHGSDQSSMPAMQHDHSKMESAPSPATAGGVYACPMHPEVQSDKPGECPKCGMTLVKRQ